ncbi:putative disease resistance protein rdl5, partial [Quercus suber]
MGRKRDRFWDYAEDLKGRFKCNYCKHEFPGGASRIKSHLAGVKGRDIVICDVVPEDVQNEAYKATQEANKKHKNASTSSNDKEGTLASTSISTIQKEKFVTQRNEEYMAEIVLDDVVDGLTIKQSLDKLVNDVAGFGLRIESLKSIIKIRLDKNEDSFLNDSEVVGREFDVLKILNELISSSNQQVISVLPIVGMAGLGKTTLAKVLYNHEEIKKHFDVLKWVRDMLSNFKFLRILKLSEDRDSIMELPDSIEQLIHLRLLHISHPQIEELPNSITKLYNLQTLRIEGPCEEVPTLGHLPCLRVLVITAMEKVRSIGSEFYSYSDGSGRNTTTLFPALRKLKWHNMKNLEEWTDAKELTSAGEVLVFPCLEELTISWLFQLRDLPDSLYTCASLQKLEVSKCHELRHLPGVPSIIFEEQCYAPLLQYLENGDSMRRLTQLKTLEIYRCPNLEDNERSKVDHIPFVNIKDGSHITLISRANSGSWQDGPAKIRILRLTCEAQKIYFSNVKDASRLFGAG